MFILQESPIDTLYANKYSNPANGALASFQGMVRADSHQDRTVSALQYMADSPACMEEGERIINEASSLFALTHVVCIQRIGKVPIGETAVWIGVWSGHRDEAFKGCRYIIEEIKKRLLIWKKELYADGSSQWVRGVQTPVIL